MYQCQEMFGQVRGEQICVMVEAAIEEACPCKQGRPCPLVAGDLRVLNLVRPV